MNGWIESNHQQLYLDNLVIHVQKLYIYIYIFLTGWPRRDWSSWCCWFCWSTCKYNLNSCCFSLFLPDNKVSHITIKLQEYKFLSAQTKPTINHFFDLEVTQLIVKLLLKWGRWCKWWESNAYNCLIVNIYLIKLALRSQYTQYKKKANECAVKSWMM